MDKIASPFFGVLITKMGARVSLIKVFFTNVVGAETFVAVNARGPSAKAATEMLLMLQPSTVPVCTQVARSGVIVAMVTSINSPATSQLPLAVNFAAFCKLICVVLAGTSKLRAACALLINKDEPNNTVNKVMIMVFIISPDLSFDLKF